jgi:hypothetical protein
LSKQTFVIGEGVADKPLAIGMAPLVWSLPTTKAMLEGTEQQIADVESCHLNRRFGPMSFDPFRGLHLWRDTAQALSGVYVGAKRKRFKGDTSIVALDGK